MAVEHINENDTLNTGRVKINAAIDQSKDAIEKAANAETNANQAVTIANEAKTQAQSTQTQLDNIIIENGQSDAEVVQARTKADGTTYPLLKDRLNDVDDKIGILNNTDGFCEYQTLTMPETYLSIPSFLGNSLTTHPSVIDFGEGNQWNGYRYWMAHTPYPGTSNENPSITASNDNITWVLPQGAPNPLVPAPSSPGYNSDVELVYLDDVDKLRMYYREFGADRKVRIYFIESSDGSNWSNPTLSIETTYLMLSPAIVRENATSWKMWTVENEKTIHYRTSNDGINWSAPIAISQPWQNWSAWHIGVRKANGKYYMLASSWGNDSDTSGTQYRPIVYASSDDGINWVGDERPQLIPVGWAGNYLYRPSFLVDESKGLKNGMPYVRVWFGASEESIAAGWHIGYAEGYLLPGDTNASLTNTQTKRKRFIESFKILASSIYASFARISRVKSKRLEIEGDYAQPLIEMRDDRVGRNGGNYVRTEYIGSDDPNSIRYSITVYDNNGNYRRISFQPFLNGFTIGDTTNPFIIGYIQTIDTANNFKITALDKNNNRFNLLQYIQSVEKIYTYRPFGETSFSDGVKFHNTKDPTRYTRLVTDSGNSLQIQLMSSTGQTYTWKFRGEDGRVDAGGGAIYNLNYISINQKPSSVPIPNGTLFEDTDGKLKYKNSSGTIITLTP